MSKNNNVNQNLENQNINENENQDLENKGLNVELEKRENALLEKEQAFKEMESRIDSKLEELKAKEEEINKQIESIEVNLPEITEAELIKNSLSIKDQLDKMPKRTVRIPINEQNPKDLVVPVTISGYTYQIKRGESVEVPEEVERILIEAKYI